MSEFDKGYLMGKGEAIMDMKRAEKKEEQEDCNSLHPLIKS